MHGQNKVDCIDKNELLYSDLAKEIKLLIRDAVD